MRLTAAQLGALLEGLEPGSLPAQLERVEQLVDVHEKQCACCGGVLHAIGEDVAECLYVVPVSVRVLVTRRHCYGCRSWQAAPVQAPGLSRIVGRDADQRTNALIAHVLVGKYADHLPLYRQAQIYARQDVTLDQSTLSDWPSVRCGGSRRCATIYLPA